MDKSTPSQNGIGELFPICVERKSVSLNGQFGLYQVVEFLPCCIDQDIQFHGLTDHLLRFGCTSDILFRPQYPLFLIVSSCRKSASRHVNPLAINLDRGHADRRISGAEDQVLIRASSSGYTPPGMAWYESRQQLGTIEKLVKSCKVPNN
ncbi:hypothetical protein BX600DRAFT_108584 [Xylariales sp. PMI_506]|nr:hypothetical protein BX600DRAFT_108584 [Xylariales sp. PMI_506]